MNKTRKKSSNFVLNGVVRLVIVIGFFAYLGVSMGMANMLNTVMKTAHDLLINTVFYLMSICVLMGALSRLFAEFGVVSLLEDLFRIPRFGDLWLHVRTDFRKCLGIFTGHTSCPQKCLFL